MARYEGSYITDKDDVDMRFIRNELRITGENYVGTKTIDCWQIDGQEIALPSYWARKQGLPGTDLTSFPKAHWPEFKGDYRKGQRSCIDKALSNLIQYRSCLIQAYTGFGKSLVGTAVISKLNTNALIIVHKTDLIKQWVDTSENFFGQTCGIVQQDTWDWKHPVVCATMQTLTKNLDNLPSGFTDHFGCLLIDEGHHLPAQSMMNIIKRIPARYKLGVSATWRRSDKLDKIWRVMFGPIDPVVKDTNSSGPRHIRFPEYRVGINQQQCFIRGKISHSKILTAVGNNQALVCELAITIADLYKEGRQILFTSHRKEQLNLMKLALMSKGLDSVLYVGGSKITKEEASKSRIILSTISKISEGTDIPSLDTLVVGTPVGDLEQVAGRITREHKGKKTPLIIYPIIQTPYLKSISHKIRRQSVKLGFK
jgi:superfamily II DNA or RNA helicase